MLLSTIVTWMSATAPDVTPEAPPELESQASSVLGVGMWIVIIACVAGVLITAGRMALAWRRGELGDTAGGLAGVFVACILVGSATSLVNFFMI